MATADELDLFMLDDLELAPSDADDTWEMPPIQDADRANRLLHAVRRLDAEAAEVNEVVDAQVARADAWRQDRLAGIDRQRQRITGVLEQYVRAVNRDDPQRKSVGLPNGRLQLTAPRSRTVVHDTDRFKDWDRAETLNLLLVAVGRLITDSEDATLEVAEGLLALAEQRSGYVRVTISPTVAALTDSGEAAAEIVAASSEDRAWALVIDGEIVPGVSIVKAKQDTFSIR